MSRKEKIITGYSKPFKADVGFAVIASGSMFHYIHHLGRPDYANYRYVGCIVSKAIIETVDIPKI